MSTRTEHVATTDGAFGLTVWPPAGGRRPVGPGVLVLQEIFGVSDYIEAAAEAWRRTEEFLARHLPVPPP